jgi:hypothetical protein
MRLAKTGGETSDETGDTDKDGKNLLLPQLRFD